MNRKKGYNRYQLSRPFEGSKIYETRSLERATRKIYNELINRTRSSDIDNVFSITDIDNKVEYNFRIDSGFNEVTGLTEVTEVTGSNEVTEVTEVTESNELTEVTNVNRPLDEIPRLDC